MSDSDVRGAPLSRRRFVRGLALAGGAAAFGGAAWGRTGQPADPQVLSGDRVDLTVGALLVNITGRGRMATVVNGSIPGPTLRLREGDTAAISLTNRLDAPTSIHWHGLRLPNDMDGVPGLTFAGVRPGETFVYRFPVVQSGTYWYHSHSGMQEQTGLHGALILEPKAKEPYAYDRDHVVLLSDWMDRDPMGVLSDMKAQGDAFNFHKRTLGTFVGDAKRKGLGAALADWKKWGAMRMSPADILDVSGAVYTYLVNGRPPAASWTALFRPGERVRLRFINAAAMTLFDVRIPGLEMTVVAADGSDVEPVEVEEFRFGPGETLDVIVQPKGDQAYPIFAQAMDRTGYASAVLAPRPGMAAAVPAMDPRPSRSMKDMGMGAMAGMNMSGQGMSGMDGGSMPGMAGMDGAAKAPMVVNADGVDPRTLARRPEVDNVAMGAKSRLDEAGDGLDGDGRRALVYGDLRALRPDPDTRPPEREIEFHLTGNMERWVWGFDGETFSEAGPIRVKLGERVRFTLINDTMMEHPIHLHGYLFSLENGQDGALPLKHTITVKPAEKASFVFTADAPGHWAFHCHLMMHMEAGMFRTVLVA